MKKCKICRANSIPLFNKNILNKYNTTYFQCEFCGYIQTAEPDWLDEAYSSAISILDVGLIERNIHYSKEIENIIITNFNSEARFLDFGGGYGMFTRIMRDYGFDYFHFDKFSDNLFANSFTLDDLLIDERKFELISAFEVMEHLVDPYKELDYIFSMTNNFVFTTELIPENEVENWWYISPEHGQHVSFYSSKSLDFLAKKYNKFYFNKAQLHIITEHNNPQILNNLDYLKIVEEFYNKMSDLKVKRKKLSSRVQTDYQKIKKLIM